MHYFTSDAHISHNNIIRYCNRPFSSVGEMNDALFDNINRLVKPDDILWHLGDFCFGPRDTDSFIRKVREYRNRILCKNVYVLYGNHDPDLFSDYEEEIRRAEEFASIFTKAYPPLYITKINHQRISLSHYAMAIWDKAHRGAINLYGHSHAGIEEWMDQIMPGRKSMDVGVDNAYRILGKYRPFSWTEIMDIMNSRPGFSRHH